MNFLKRSVTSIKRTPIKSLTLLLIVFTLGTAAIGALSVNGAVNSIDENLRARMRPIVSLSFDYWAFMESLDWDDPDAYFSNRPTLATLEELQQVGGLPQVRFYDFMINSFVDSFELIHYVPEGYEDNAWRGEELRMFALRGTSTTNMVQIDQGIIELIAGRQFNHDDLLLENEHIPVIVSAGFADINNLHLNSIFEIYNIIATPTDPMDPNSFNPNWFHAPYRHAKLSTTFEIIGMFELPPKEDVGDPWNDYATRRIDNLNIFYIPNLAVEAINYIRVEAILESWEHSNYDYTIEPQLHAMIMSDISRNDSIHSIFVINDFNEIEDFRYEAVQLLPEFYSVEDLSNTFANLESSMLSMQELANGIFIASVLASILIITLLILLFVRDRRHEVGVYLALGEKKAKILLQILAEVVIISFIGITLAVLFGNIITSQISRNILTTELTAMRSDEMHFNPGNIMEIFGVPTHEMPIADIVETFDLSLDIFTIAMIYALGLLVIVISTVLPIWLVVKRSPKEALL